MTAASTVPGVIVVNGRDGDARPASVEAAVGALGLAVHPVSDAGAAIRAFETITGGGGEITAFVLVPALAAPVAAARRIHAAAPAVHLVFVLDDRAGGPVRRELALAPRIGTGWTSTFDDGVAVLTALRDAVRATRQRTRMRTTLTRVRSQLTSREPGPGRAYDPEADELRRRTRLEVTQALVDEPDLAAAAPRILAALARGLGWCCAILWMVDPAARRLRCAEVWRADEVALGELAEASRQLTFGPGEGRPGQAWQDRRARMVDDLATDGRYARSEVAARQDLHTGYFQPIMLGDNVLGVIELVGYERRERDADFEELMASAATSIAQLAERGRIERALRVHVEELVAADRRKNEFLAVLSHELRNPLAPIGNAVRVLQDAASDPVDRSHGLAVIERQVASLGRLVDDLLDVSRISTGTLQINRARVAVSDVIGRAVETVRPAIEGGGLTLTVAVPGEPLWLDADPLRIEQVLTNLLVNAGKYTDRGGRIWLTASPAGSPATGRRVVIAVRDTGIGISEELRGQIFDLWFAQAKALRDRDRDRGGLGIGLTLVKRLVDLHGGEISVDSAGVNRGSVFTVRLPVAQADA